MMRCRHERSLTQVVLRKRDLDYISLSSPHFSVRRETAPISSGCETHPAAVAPAGSNRSNNGGNEVVEAFGVKVRARRHGERAGRN